MHFHYGILEHSRDITLLIVYCDLISCTTPACFSTFYRCAMVPTLVLNSNLFEILVSIDLPSFPSGVVAGACIRATVTIICECNCSYVECVDF